jgi:Ca2+:H+ antiporter
MAYTVEMLVESIEYVRDSGNIADEWFGLILLPIVSFAADGTSTSAFVPHDSLSSKLP